MKPAFFWTQAAVFMFVASLTAQTATNAFLPIVSLRAPTTPASESGATVAVTVARDGTNSWPAPLTVSYAISGMASNGVDYVLLNGSIEIPAGAFNTNFVVVPIDDSIKEPNEGVILKLLASEQYRIGTYSNVTVQIVDNDNLPPVVHLVQPTNNSQFMGPTNITLRAEASDADGLVKRVEFYKGSTLLGSIASQNATNVFSLTWSNAQPASAPYVLTARAIDNLESRSTSGPVNVVILGQSNSTPIVNVVATDSNASETSTNTTVNSSSNPGTFRFSRTGSTNSSLSVYFELGGTAVNQVDYHGLPTMVTIPAGATNTFLHVTPIDDSLVEGGEQVVVTLRTNSAYLLGEVRSATVTIFDNDTATNIPPFVAITSPTNKAVFTTPVNVPLWATATDTNGGWVQAVEFFVGTNRLGIVTNNPLSTTPVNPFHFTWTNAPAGEHILTAKARDNEGAERISEPVAIKIESSTPPRTVVRIEAIDTQASEGLTSLGTNTALFKVIRSGVTNVPVTVFLAVGGTASNGVDYVAIPDSITIPEGAWFTHIIVRPLDDTLIEGNESVMIGIETPICAAIYPPPPECYEVGLPAGASAVILDNDPVNGPPSVRLVSPTNNSVFVAPANIEMTADATDSDGNVVRVDFFVGDHLLGSDTASPFSLLWTNVAAGYYTLSARATDNANAIRWSEPVRISVRTATELSFTRREMPIWYVPGVKFLVRLRAEPRTNTVSYWVEDTPPPGWPVTVSGTNGIIDTITGKVKFGPFSDGLARTFHYEVVPPLDATGEKRFSGIANANGTTSPITGSGVIVHAPPHPGDKDGNFSLGADEVSSYAVAWKRCERWSVSPNPIPVNYVTRAGYLGAADFYRLSTNYPTPVPPLIWVRQEMPVLFNGTSSDEVPWFTNRSSAAVSIMPTNYSPGVAFTVTLHVTPPSNTVAQAVEERPPLGWVVSQISHGGVFCPLTGKIRWGLFLDSTGRSLTYQVTPATTNAPALAQFAGVASFDGINVPITGQRSVRRSTTIAPARLESVKMLADGNRLLTFLGEPGLCYTLEGSSDLADWIPVETMLNNDGVLQYIDLSTTNQPLRFYRAVVKE